jgi:hypothetical protein
MAPPSGTTLTPYTQAYTYDALDRLSSGPAGTYSSADANQVHAVTALGTIPNPYAASDAMGDMTCRNTDTSSAHACASSSPSGCCDERGSAGDNWPPGVRPLAQWAARILSTTCKATAC